MKRYFTFSLILTLTPLLLLSLLLLLLPDSPNDLPVSYQGRYRPLAVYTKKIGKDIHSLLESSQMEVQDNNTSYKQLHSSLKTQGFSNNQIHQRLEEAYPVRQRLTTITHLLPMIPDKRDPEKWHPLSAVAIEVFDTFTSDFRPIGNFSAFANEDFRSIQEAYLKGDLPTKELRDAYRQFLSDSSSTFPSLFQLKTERLLFTLPFLPLIIAGYCLGAILFGSASIDPTRTTLRSFGRWFILIAFGAHTLLLILRCYVLERPPVSNMFETELYVPWIALAATMLFNRNAPNSPAFPLSSALAAWILLFAFYSPDPSSLENIQPVLNSNFWLAVHVLMVVGSYGCFLLAAVLGHFYCARFVMGAHLSAIEGLSQLIWRLLCLGVLLLIPGTLLGGVWAAQSWGRFWDWDPKESWAFISSAIYLLIIHLYRYGKIARFGLAVGSIVGGQAIVFTWYGVNYLLGTGLHSYGFGDGGNGWYYGYMGFECVFLLGVALRYRKRSLVKP